MAQTKKEKCIVTIVDDCSTEDLKPIIENFKKYIKINYIKLSKNLKYPGLVRQIGLENSIAPFVMFLDSDDMLDPTAIELLHDEMLKSDRDVIIGYFFRQTDKGDFVVMKEDSTTWLHGNVYRRSFLEKNNICFSSGYNEDGAFNTQCYMLSDKIGILKKPIMYWMYNKDSITRKVNDFSLMNGHYVVSTLNFAYQNIFAQNGRNEKVIQNMGVHWSLFYGLLNQLKEKEKENSTFEKFENLLKDELNNFSQKLNIRDFSEEEKNSFKRGFIRGLQKYGITDKYPYFTPETFINIFKLGFDLEIFDFLYFKV